MPAPDRFPLGGEEEHMCVSSYLMVLVKGTAHVGAMQVRKGTEEGRGPGVTVCVSPVPAAAKLCGLLTASELAIAPGNQDLSCSTAGEYVTWLHCES